MNDSNRPVWMIENGEPAPTCGLWWTLTTLLTAIAIGAAFGVAVWLLGSA